MIYLTSTKEGTDDKDDIGRISTETTEVAIDDATPACTRVSRNIHFLEKGSFFLFSIYCQIELIAVRMYNCRVDIQVVDRASLMALRSYPRIGYREKINNNHLHC